MKVWKTAVSVDVSELYQVSLSFCNVTLGYATLLLRSRLSIKVV